MSRHKSEYAKLRDLWYDKLKAEGFEDIEDSEYTIKVWSSRFAKLKDVDTWQQKADYYYIANHFLNSYEFDSELEKIIWEYHTNCISIRDITQLLRDTKVLDTNRDYIWLIIKRLKAIMKRMYL